MCADAAAAATAAAAGLTPTTTEYRPPGVLARELLDRELDPIVLLVGGGTASTRTVTRCPPATPWAPGACSSPAAAGTAWSRASPGSSPSSRSTADERDAYERLLAVEQAFLDASRVGRPARRRRAAGTAAYAAQGFDPNEWHRHHQGGFSGFQPREFPASPASDDVVPEGAVLAWNPSGGGWKVEDTTLVEAAGPETLVHDDTWPTVKVGGPAPARRPRPLTRRSA